MAQTENYKCPACTGPLRFVGTSGRLECEYCGSAFSVEEIESAHSAPLGEAHGVQSGESAESAQAEGGESWSDEFEMKTLNCSSCGAQLYTDANTVATHCPYCGNPTIIPSQFTGGRKPDFVIPFALDKNQAVQALKSHYEGKKLLPDVFKDENHIEEIKGVYVPFWLFDADADADLSFVGTRSSSRIYGDFRIVRTDHYTMRRAGTVSFSKVPVDASKKMDNDLMDSIEPFDYAKMKPFSASYLPGFLAESYDESESECESRFVRRSARTAIDIMRGDLERYDTVSSRGERVDVKKTSVSYALFPVWLLNTTWDGKNYRFAMNGQTGKFVGNLPCDSGKYWSRFFTFFLVFGSIAAFVSFFLF